jgi:hypothetical protein
MMKDTMMMKTLIAAAALLVCSASAMAAQPDVAAANISASTLQGMGLATMRTLTDREGLTVRGKGTFANVWGGSTANWGGQTSSNNYSASSAWLGKPAGASGSSFSFAGQLQSQFQGFGRFGR